MDAEYTLNVLDGGDENNEDWHCIGRAKTLEKAKAEITPYMLNKWGQVHINYWSGTSWEYDIFIDRGTHEELLRAKLIVKEAMIDLEKILQGATGRTHELASSAYCLIENTVELLEKNQTAKAVEDGEIAQLVQDFYSGWADNESKQPFGITAIQALHAAGYRIVRNVNEKE